ncbi:NAD(P)/FAD-dependent oxidoreductase [Magnetospira sp. QH-2]|uniref:NAD(P)/FAD-dependent oxidoreductase n=1 Tax=Magnetospira sp. (strain QH-2) TaxID=1288970 RepID=UPI0003E81522|nr:NAD(P)/FAD-dependent oxidoreductase [Magnetospira sp. QH-2]CCQ72585.1 putative thioredoxin reductase [Magnetospira sp. QH-2]
MSQPAIHVTDVAVVGAGPTGLFAVFECGMLKMTCHVIDPLDMVGGQLSALYPEKPIYDIPGLPAIQAGDLVTNLEKQAAAFDPVYHLGERVEKLVRTDDERFLLETSKGTRIDAKAVIIAAGAGAFGPNRPPLANIEQYEGDSVFYMVSRREAFRGRRVVIAGGGDSAVDWALSLHELAEKIYVVHRRPKFRAAPESAARLKALSEDGTGKLELVVPYQLDSLEGEGSTLSAVNVKTLDGDIRRLDADVLLPFYGLATDLGPIAEWGLNLDMHHITVESGTLATNKPGIFAIGDVATYEHKLKLILCGFSEAAMAAHAVRDLVYPDEALHFEYSTSLGVPHA